MAALAEAFVRIRPDTSTFKRETEEGVTRGSKGVGSKAGVSIGQSLGGGMRVGVFKSIPGIAKGLVGAFAVVKGVQVFGGFIEDARESAKVSRITEQAIRSTGGAAKVTAGQVGDLATAISNKTGADDETVQSGQNLLLTFTNIRNEVGKGNDIFNQASASVVDLAAAMNNGEVTTNGVKTASIQLGKALNDPIKGVTALRKVGVSFTAQQTDQISKLVKSGKTLDAQKIILRELGKEFGGTAAAAADPMTKLQTILGNLGESVGGLLLPVVGKFANLLGNTVVPALYEIGGAFKLVLGDDGAQGFAEVMDHALGNTGKLVPVFRSVGEGIRQLVFGFQALIAAFKDGDVTSDGFVGAMERLGVQARVAFGFFQTYVVPVLKTLATILLHSIIPALIGFGGWLVRSRSWLIPIAVGIGAIVAALKIWTAVTRIHTAVTKAYAIVQGILNVVMTANPIGLVVLAVVGLVAALITAYKTSDTFRRIVDTAFKAVKGAAIAVYNWVKSNWPLLLGILTGPIGAAVILIVRNWDKIKAGASALWSALKSIWQTGVRLVVNLFLGLVQTVLDGAAKAFGWVPGLGGKLKKAASDFRTFRDQTNSALGGVKSRSVTVTAALIASQKNAVAGNTGGGGVRQRFATGGPIFGAGTATSDSIPALLSNGEHVLTAREVRAFGGHSAVTAMRREVVKGFAAGGAVGFDIDTRLTGLAKFETAITAFNTRVDAMARKLAAASGFSANLAGVVNFARSQAGKPYVWGAAGPGGYDCSGFVSALVNVAQGRSPYSRRFSTGTLPAGLFAPGSGAFNIGWFTGNPGHVAATVNGIPMESRGGDGVVVGSRSRGAGQSIFNRHGHLIGFARGGPVLPGDAPFDILDPRGLHFRPGLMEALQSVRSFDTGGWLPPRSMGVWQNNTSRPERVRTADQEDKLAAALAGLDRRIADRIAEQLSGVTLVVEGDTARFVARGLAGAGNRGRGR